MASETCLGALAALGSDSRGDLPAMKGNPCHNRSYSYVGERRTQKQTEAAVRYRRSETVEGGSLKCLGALNLLLLICFLDNVQMGFVFDVHFRGTEFPNKRPQNASATRQNHWVHIRAAARAETNAGSGGLQNMRQGLTTGSGFVKTQTMLAKQDCRSAGDRGQEWPAFQ